MTGQPAKLAESPKRILIVDDTAYFRDLLEQLLTRAGYRVEVVSTGQKAYEAIRKEPARYDLVIVDVLLPDALGLEVIEKLKGERETGHVPLVALTGVVRDPLELRKIRAVGALGTIHRSMPPEEILFKVNRLLLYPEDERRASRRIVVNSMIEYVHQGAKFFGYLFTMSVTGVFIRTIYPLQLKSQIRMAFTLPGEEEPLECEGVVTRIVGQEAEHEGELDETDIREVPGMGVMFQNLVGDKVLRIEGFIKARLDSGE